jgi:hypothetical protein
MTGISRRLFGQMMAAAPLAAPTIAEEVAKRVGGMSLGGEAAMGMAQNYHSKECSVSPMVESDWLRERLAAEMKRLAELDAAPNREMWQRQWHGVEARRLDGLRSVSPGAKARMMTEWTESQSRNETRGYIQREIEHLKERLGPLALLL